MTKPSYDELADLITRISRDLECDNEKLAEKLEKTTPNPNIEGVDCKKCILFFTGFCKELEDKTEELEKYGY